LTLALALSGCATVGYYLQALGGHLEVVARARPIPEVLEDKAASAETRAKLEQVLAIRAFATRELKLPDNESYRRYADLERPYALWNVFAAPELSLKPLEWCFVMVGCVSYRGYFSHAHAEAFAAELRASGHDVYVGGVAAYSTLGWFDDPMLNTVLRRAEPEIAGIMFHELAHQKLYARDDTAFNESFATAVELEGVKRWFAAGTGNAKAFAEYETRFRRRGEFTALLLKHRARLEAIYGSDRPDADKRAAKTAAFAQLKRGYAALKAAWGDYDGYDTWMAQDLNNAHLVSAGTYHQWVPALRALLAQNDHDLARFYRAVEELARRSRAEREAALLTLGGKP